MLLLLLHRLLLLLIGLLRLRNGLLLLLVLLFLHRLLLLLLVLISLRNGLLLLLLLLGDLSRRVVVVIAATDQRQSCRPNPGPSRGAQEGASGHS